MAGGSGVSARSMLSTTHAQTPFRPGASPPQVGDIGSFFQKSLMWTSLLRYSCGRWNGFDERQNTATSMRCKRAAKKALPLRSQKQILE
jgi:hypothetical protein